MYNPKEYWSKRLEENFSLSGVGFTSFGRNYNKWLYKMRKKVLERAILKYQIDFPKIRILDIGCGTGFYVDMWQKKGVRYLTGIDITAISIREVVAKYPTFNFYEADITSPTLIQDLNLREKSFDLITAFDVLFHIVDDDKFGQAIKNIGMLCSEDGLIFVTDIFPHKRPYVILHQKSRLLKDYVQVLSKNGIKIIDRIPVHYLLNAPLDISIELLQKILLRFWWGGDCENG
jgi:2-polyprenyl-3-methyl-5-hydroxy-6-metoxy-1,4-benzoquinol methylase